MEQSEKDIIQSIKNKNEIIATLQKQVEELEAELDEYRKITERDQEALNEKSQEVGRKDKELTRCRSALEETREILILKDGGDSIYQVRKKAVLRIDEALQQVIMENER